MEKATFEQRNRLAISFNAVFSPQMWAENSRHLLGLGPLDPSPENIGFIISLLLKEASGYTIKLIFHGIFVVV